MYNIAYERFEEGYPMVFFPENLVENIIIENPQDPENFPGTLYVNEFFPKNQWAALFP